MIKGIGTDIIAINRIQTIIARHGNRFLRKVFTGPEIAIGESKADQAVYFAGRWAAKEAFYKALPRSCQSVSSWKSIQVLSHKGSGRPEVEICSSVLKQRLRRANIGKMHLSISHEQSICIAFVVLE